MSTRDRAAILFEPDGYLVGGPKLMGRHMAGNGFLRAAVASFAGEPFAAWTPHRASAETFVRVVRELDPDSQPCWIPANRHDLLEEVGCLYLPGPDLGQYAWQRQRRGASAWSLVGVTHTTASHNAMDAIAGLLDAPVMPWDALICTSRAVVETVELILDAQRDHLVSRHGACTKLRPQLPVIPLGAHCADFAFDADTRASARAAMGIPDDAVVCLFVGRLSFHAKAHPHAMYLGLQAAATAAGRPVWLVQCGWFANDFIRDAFVEGAARFCPAVTTRFVDGRDAAARDGSWAAADIFISLSDNIQETFGLTPVEAMAAGLPVVVTDWDGYRDTVRDGVDGFCIPTAMPSAPAGESLALDHEVGSENYDLYCGLACQMVSVDLDALSAALLKLITSPDLRLRMGDAGRERARKTYDWAVIVGLYRDLFRTLGELRDGSLKFAGSAQSELERTAARPSRLDPFAVFAGYPTRRLDASTRIAHRHVALDDAYARLRANPLFSYASAVLPDETRYAAVMGQLESGPRAMQELADALDLPLSQIQRDVAVLLKMGLITLPSSMPPPA